MTREWCHNGPDCVHVFGIWLRLWSRNTRQDRALLPCSVTQERLFRGLSRTVSPTTSPPCRFTTYLPQHNFDSRFPFTQGWPTVVLPLQAHVQPKSASRLDMNCFVGFGDQTSIPFFFPEISTFPAFLRISPVITDLTTLGQWSSALKGVTAGSTSWCL